MIPKSLKIETLASPEQCYFASHPVPSEVLLSILDRANELPLGFESHPWRILIIDNQKQKAKLALAINNDLVLNSPLVLIFVADTRVWSSQFGRFLNNYSKLKSITQTRAESLCPISYGLPSRFSLVDNVKALVSSFRSPPKPWWQFSYNEKQIEEIVSAQTKLAAANFIVEAKLEDIESILIENYDDRKLSSFLKLSRSVVVAALVCAGYPQTREN